MPPIEIFFSYSHKDEHLMDKVRRQLIIYDRQKLIQKWHDRKILPGQEFGEIIDDHIERAQIILLFVSPNFIESEYCYEVEMKRALQRHESGDAIAIPIILRPCPWRDAPFSHIQVLPKDGLAVTQWKNRDEATLNVAQGVMRVVRQLSSQKKSPNLHKANETRGVEIRENILDKLSDYHRKGRRVKISQVINWFKHKYEREQILQELERLQREKVIKFDEKNISRSTDIRLLKNGF